MGLRRGAGVGVAVIMSAGVLLCAACQSGNDRPDAAQADTVAATAGTVMVRGPGPRPAPDAAAEVTGTRTDRSIEALQADGTTYQGTVVLRITTRLAGPEGSTPVIRCYRYVFRHRLEDVTPHPMDNCPSRPALTLPSPAPPAEVTDATRSTLIAALKTLTPVQLKSASAIQAALKPQFPPPLQVIADGPGTGVNAAIYVTITNTLGEYATSCVSAYLVAGHPWRILPVATGTRCRGG